MAESYRLRMKKSEMFRILDALELLRDIFLDEVVINRAMELCQTDKKGFNQHVLDPVYKAFCQAKPSEKKQGTVTNFTDQRPAGDVLRSIYNELSTKPDKLRADLEGEGMTSITDSRIILSAYINEKRLRHQETGMVCLDETLTPILDLPHMQEHLEDFSQITDPNTGEILWTILPGKASSLLNHLTIALTRETVN